MTSRSCGREFATSGAIIQDLCSVGTDAKVYGSPQEAQLVRQCAAAALNMAASLELGGSCSASFDLFAGCCTSCGAPAAGCIEDLDAFNNSGDTLLQGGSEIDLCHALGLSCAAQPSQCQAAKGNGFVNDRSVTAAASSATVVSATTAGTSPTSGGCSGGPGGLLALLGAVGLLALRRR